MLILERRQEQQIFITLPTGELVVVKFLGLDARRQCRIGIDAPPHVPMVRSELLATKEKRS